MRFGHTVSAADADVLTSVFDPGWMIRLMFLHVSRGSGPVLVSSWPSRRQWRTR